ncbi:MAG TPA: hypothetical protein VMD25_02625 [Acidobacteriaceae bacterium]|nr:hypothetical protein [Acidobacteriaceae bacterium]
MPLRCCAPFALAAAVWLAAPSAFTQNAPVITAPPSGIHGFAGEPYSATFISLRHQTLADGTQITRATRTVRYRDSLGRTRFEFYPPTNAGDADSAEPAMVNIIDPVANRTIQLNPRQKTATISTPHTISQVIPNTPPRAAGVPGTGVISFSSSGNPSAAPRPTVEDLGYETIDGVIAHGRRVTRIIPAGAEGNDREITVVSESWTCEELRITVQSSVIDPRSGESTMEAQDISRDEPDPILFQIPPDYSVTQQN